MRTVRILLRILRETTIGLKRSGWSNWLVVSILAVALTIFGGVLQTTMAIKEVVSSWGSQLEISAYLKDGFEPQKVAKTVSQLPEVQLVEIVPKEVAWSEMQANYKVAALSNPLPNTLHVKLASVEAVEKTADRLKALSAIEHIRFPLKVARNLNRVRQFLEIAGFVITGALSAATLVVIGNTIHLVIESRQREIEILSLTGVSPWYIKGPLILQGASYGLAAASIAGAILFGLISYMNPYLHEQLGSFLPMSGAGTDISLLPTFVVVVTLGVAVGAGGSAWTSGKYIKI
jgi:cell division transport system permease protein